MASIFNTSRDDQIAIENRRRIAEALIHRGSEPLADTGMAGGLVVPTSPLSALNKVFQSVAGSYLANRADKQRMALQDKQNEALANIDFNSPDAPKQLLASGQNDIAMALLKQRLPELKTGTPGMGFIPRGSKPYTEETTGFTGFQTPEGDLIPSRFSMNEYQQVMTDPTRRKEIISGEEQARIVPVKMPDGSIQYMPKGIASGTAQTTPLPEQASIDQGTQINNPGNIRPTGQSTGFQSYADPQAGLKAIDDNLAAYGNKGINTLSGVISRWSPPNENDTTGLINSASKRLGIDPNQPIDLNDPVQRQIIGSVIALQENPVFKQKSGPIRSISPAQEAEAIAKAKQPIELATKQAAADIENKQKLQQTQQAAAIDLPKAIDEANYSIKLLDEIKTHPGLNTSVGALSVLNLRAIPGTPAADFQTRMDQLQGQQFLNAYQMLKGGGQITEIEGEKATAAMARMNPKQSQAEFKKSIDELKGVLIKGMERAKQKAGIPNSTIPVQQNKPNLSIDDLVNIYKR